MHSSTTYFESSSAKSADLGNQLLVEVYPIAVNGSMLSNTSYFIARWYFKAKSLKYNHLSNFWDPVGSTAAASRPTLKWAAGPVCC